MEKLPGNEKGLTLIEVLASIVLLSIVIVSFLSLFPQITNFNDSTEENLQAAAVAKEVRVLVKEEGMDISTPQKTSFLSNETLTNLDDTILHKGEYNDFSVEVTIWKNKKYTSEVYEDLYQMKVSILNENNNEISYTYGYISN